MGARVRPVIILTIEGDKCFGCSFFYYGRCNLFSQRVNDFDRLEDCMKAEKEYKGDKE